MLLGEDQRRQPLLLRSQKLRQRTIAIRVLRCRRDRRQDKSKAHLDSQNALCFSTVNQ